MGRKAWAFIYFLPMASLTLIPWITGSLFPCLGCSMILVYPSGSTPSLSVDDIKRLLCPWASSWIWLMRAFTWDLRDGGKTRVFIHCIHPSNIKIPVCWPSQLFLCSGTSNHSLSLHSSQSRSDNSTSLLPVLVISL